MGVFQRTLAIAFSGTALCAVGIGQAQAQSKAPSAARTEDKVRRFSISAGPLALALKAWSRQTGRSVIFRSDDVATRRTAGVKGRMTGSTALERLIDGTGFVVQNDGAGAVALQLATRIGLPASGDGDPIAAAGTAGGATPDILVTGKRSWTLNAGIPRSQDDSQPFIVLSGEEIRRSGAPNLETFLRDRLNVNAAPGVSEQAAPSTPGGLPDGRGLSSINLRGLGVRDTLILVDGRRQPGINIGNGQLTQAQITGIPIASIERIEVLASSASGIYGSGASGGVVNIVTKRNFSGGEITGRYGNTSDFEKGDAQVDVTYGLPLEGGRTRLAFAGSWQKGLPLLFGDREFLARRMREQLIANDPTFFNGVNFVPFGSAVNYRTVSGRPLQLKPQFGGTTLSSAIGTVPAGFNGIAADGIAPLLSGVGRYDENRANNSVAPGLRTPILYGSKLVNGSMTVRREFNNSLSGYLSLNMSRSESISPFSRGPNYITLNRTAPNNPFTENLRVALPGIAPEVNVSTVTTHKSLVAGVIVKLPYEWQALVDVSYARSQFRGDIRPSSFNEANSTELRNGIQNVLRDLTRNPLRIGYDATPFGNAREPSGSSTFTPSLRLAGPVPITLPGGRPQMTVNIEYNSDHIASSRGTFFSGRAGITSYQPASNQKILSLYGEIALPLIDDNNDVALVRQLELRLAARGERYSGDGGQEISCAINPLNVNARNPFGQCPGPNDVIVRDVTRNSRIDPSISFRWFPVESLMMRGSYTTGFLPPSLSQLVKQTGRLSIGLVDIARGSEAIGFYPDELGLTIDGSLGGNPDVLPESSRTFSMGAVFTPKGGLLEGLRVSVDWTQVKKRNIYFSPTQLLIGSGPAAQSLFNRFVQAKPERVTRAAPSDGFPVGPITGIDASLVNLNGMETEALDFVLDYTTPLLSGMLSVTARATTVLSLTIDPFPGEPVENYRGVAPSRGFASIFAPGGLDWRASGAVTWNKGPFTANWSPRYINRYRISRSTAEVRGQGSAFVPAQLYHDVNISYRFPFSATLTAGINNVFNKLPPLDATAYPQFYSGFADPRLRNFYLSMSKSF